MKVSNPKYNPEQVGLNPDDLPDFGQVSAEEGFTADCSDWNKNMCITHPKLVFSQMGNYKYSIYNLDGVCNCGKKYGQHPHFVKHNEEIEAEIRQKIDAELENAKANSEKMNLEFSINSYSKLDSETKSFLVGFLLFLLIITIKILIF